MKLTDQSTIIKIPRCHLAATEEEIIDKEFSVILDLGIIQKSDSPFNFPLLVVKQGAKNRVCFDFRQLNKHLEGRYRKEVGRGVRKKR